MIVTTNPQLVRGSLGKNWIVKRYGHASRMRNTSFSGSAKSLPESTSRNRLTVSLQYDPKSKKTFAETNTTLACEIFGAHHINSHEK